MLTETEKQILGIMVDMSQLVGAQREAVGASDVVAREKILDFKTRMMASIPTEIQSLTTQKNNYESEIVKQNALLTLLGE